MTHFATPCGASSPAEDELSLVFDDGTVTQPGCFRPLGLLLVEDSPRLIVVVIAAAARFKADERWIR